jgi:hypothetical protein
MRNGDLASVVRDELQEDGKLLTFLAIELRSVPFAQQWQTLLYV